MTAEALKLRLVEKPAFDRKDLPQSRPDLQGDYHSLHSLLAQNEGFDPDLVSSLLDSYTVANQVVLDPFCGNGTVGLESALRGRVPVLSDVNKLSLTFTHALLTPVDISEITLALQLIPFSRPVDVSLHDANFEPFFDVRTFCELINLRASLKVERSSAAVFIKAVAASLLHGQSSGYFSAYTNSNIALPPLEQKKLNQKRRQVPDYRPVMPRVLRKTAALLRDGVPSAMRKAINQGALKVADARNLNHVPTGSVDCVITKPCGIHAKYNAGDQWLKLWFLGLSPESLASELLYQGAELSHWLEFMSECLFEMSRVVKSGGRVILNLPDQITLQGLVNPAEELLELVQDNFARFFDPECLLSRDSSGELIGSHVKPLHNAHKALAQRVLVLKRR